MQTILELDTIFTELKKELKKEADKPGKDLTLYKQVGLRHQQVWPEGYKVVHKKKKLKTSTQLKKLNLAVKKEVIKQDKKILLFYEK